ncbi:hypothetical protein MNB_SM-3-1019 [hydrothermal vent metagenome]|uniref:Uncharacterized protein n=1 Tax=hydrothermal vent metagenome TaxID=652676 RepID=A0A1W1D4R3_9ZZZZ
MGASQKTIESGKRLRYVRALERFHKSIVSYLSNNPEPSYEVFLKKVKNGMKYLQRVEEVQLYKGELQDLQNLVKLILSYQENSADILKIQDEIIYRSNQLEKSKNAKRYKKDKHVKSKYKDWES